MGQVTEGAFIIGLQYSSAMLESSQKELELMQEALNAVSAMETAKMLVVKSEANAEAFKRYKGALTKLSSFRQATMKKRNSAALRAGKKP